MMGAVNAAIAVFDLALSGLDPSLLSGVDCANLVEALARIEKRCAAVRALAAARAASCGTHRQRGFPDPTSWLAHTCGVSTADARNMLNAVSSPESAPMTREALLAGELSLAQAAEITKTEKAAPGSEADLLDLAGRSSITGLRDAARKRRLETQDPEQVHRRQRRERYFRHWQDDHGMIRFSGSFTPEVGVPLCNRIDTETDRIARATATSQGGSGLDADTEREPWDCLTADAVAKLIMEGGTGRTRNAELVLVCDVAAFHRGHTHSGEVCHIIGGGPVPVHVAWDLARDSFIKAVLHDGVAIANVAHYGRRISAELRTALGLGHPPTFEGAVCAEPGCDRRYHLEWDHIDPVAHGGPTSFENLEPLCKPGHREKTRRDRQDGLLQPSSPKSEPPSTPEPAPSLSVP